MKCFKVLVISNKFCIKDYANFTKYTVEKQHSISFDLKNRVSEFLQEHNRLPLFSLTPCKKDMHYYSLTQIFPISIYNIATGTVVIKRNQQHRRTDLRLVMVYKAPDIVHHAASM